MFVRRRGVDKTATTASGGGGTRRRRDPRVRQRGIDDRRPQLLGPSFVQRACRDDRCGAAAEAGQRPLPGGRQLPVRRPRHARPLACPTKGSAPRTGHPARRHRYNFTLSGNNFPAPEICQRNFNCIFFHSTKELDGLKV